MEELRNQLETQSRPNSISPVSASGKVQAGGEQVSSLRDPASGSGDSLDSPISKLSSQSAETSKVDGDEGYFGEEEDEMALTDYVKLAKSFYGSRFIQNSLEASAAADFKFFQHFFDQAKDRITELMTDKFARFAIERLLTYCNDQHRRTLLENIGSDLRTIASDNNGSFGLQMLVQALHSNEQLQLLVSLLEPCALKLMTDYKGHYLMVLLVCHFPCDRFEFIDRTIIDNIVEVSTCTQVCTRAHACHIVFCVLSLSPALHEYMPPR